MCICLCILYMHIAMEAELSFQTAFRGSAPHHGSVRWLCRGCYMDEHRGVRCH